MISKPLLSVRNSCISLCDVENDLETCCLIVGEILELVLKKKKKKDLTLDLEIGKYKS